MLGAKLGLKYADVLHQHELYASVEHQKVMEHAHGPLLPCRQGVEDLDVWEQVLAAYMIEYVQGLRGVCIEEPVLCEGHQNLFIRFEAWSKYDRGISTCVAVRSAPGTFDSHHTPLRSFRKVCIDS